MIVATRLVVLLCCLALVACGERAPEDEAAATATATPTAAAGAGGSTALGSIGTDLSKKPTVHEADRHTARAAPDEGHRHGQGAGGEGRRHGQMQYVGMAWSDGKQFDASWDRGQPFTFQLGTAT